MIVRFKNVIKKVRKYGFDALRRPFVVFTPKDPVYIFHHIPKCGGSSFTEVLDNWFITIRDYRFGTTLNYPEKVDLDILRSCHCLCGHFEIDGYFLRQRYPEVFMSDRYKIFTSIRDPLQIQLSLFRYNKKIGVSETSVLEDHLFLRPNFLAYLFSATLDNYKEVIDRYFFVGILENAQASLDILASLMGKNPKVLPKVNITQNAQENDSRGHELPDELISRFKSHNSLDYLIYNYCVEKFNRRIAELGSTSFSNSAKDMEAD